MYGNDIYRGVPIIDSVVREMSRKPKYWDSWRGKVLRAIIYDGATTWKEVKERTNLDHGQLYKAVGELQRTGVIDYSGFEEEKIFRVLDGDIERAYKSVNETPIEESPALSQRHNQWIQSWIESDEVNASLENNHFFVEGTHLSYLSRRLMDRAQKSILVINPFVDRAGLGTALRDAAKRGVETLLISRKPESYPDREEFHRTLKDAGVELYYSGKDGGVHSKLLIVDEEVAIVSSLNFTRNAEAAVSWETGIVSVDKDVVESSIESVRTFRDEDETKAV